MEILKIGKVANNVIEAEKIQEDQINKPHGKVQWKGTDVCMDVYCKCGIHTHIDDWFVYNVKCGSCGTVYNCNPNIEFIEVLEPSDDDMIVTSQ